MEIVKRYRQGASFWKENPQIDANPRFNYIKTTEKKISSDLMWSIALIYDYDSDYRGMDITERIKEVERMMLGEGYFKDHPHEDLIEAYNDLQFDSPRQMLETQKQLISDRNAFLKNTSGSLDPAIIKLREDMGKNTKLIYNTYKEIKKDVETFEAETNVQGGYTPSGLETDKETR